MDWGSCLDNGSNGSDVATIKCIEPLFNNIITAVVSLAGLALFLMLIIGGFNFLFAGADPKKMEQARGTLTNALIGIIVIVAAYLIISFIGQFTGLQNLLNNFTANVN